MAGNSESNDASDLFWPGYVDAVTNLAINLLFVIAVMSIVVIGVTLQISQIIKKRTIEETPAVKTAVSTAVAQQKKDGAPASDANSQEEEVQKLKQSIQLVEKKLEQTEKQLKDTQAKLASAGGGAPTVVVQATQNKPQESQKANRVQTVSPADVVVRFDPSVVTLSASEVSNLVTELKKISPLTTGRWKITVISPKGYSEAARLSFYRANAARSALIENGVSGQAIEMQIVESEQAGADNSKVLIKWLP